MSQGATAYRPKRKTIRLPVDIGGGDVRTALAQTEFLAHIPPEKLTELIKVSFVRTFKDGAVIVEQGTYGHSLFVLVRGAYKVRVETDTGTVLDAGFFDTPSLFFGEMALLGRRRRSASILAVGETVLVELEKTKIEMLDREVGGVLERLELSSRLRTIRTYVEQHRYLKDLDEQAKKFIADNARVTVHERGSTVFEQGEEAEHVMFVKNGVTKLVRQKGETESVLAYFNTGDVIGVADYEVWPASMVSMGYVEMITMKRSAFISLKANHKELFEHFAKDVVGRYELQRELAGKNTVMAFVEEIVAEGAHEGQSLLTINLNVCIRCGNCTRSCQARHGYSKMKRTGKKLVRREKLHKKGSRQTILLPGSCRHCVNPECMIGCPTGAIHRTPGGEVDIHDFCIGCASCANRCPWGNITMVQIERMVDGEKRNQMASKCNLCEGYSHPNCVHNCPTGAILRVEPKSFFPELRHVLGQELARNQEVQQKVGGARTRREALSQPSKILVPLMMLITMAALVAVYLTPVMPLFGHHDAQQLLLGAVALGCMLAAIGLAFRRRINRFRLQFGRFQMWTRIHIAFGLTALVAVLLHSRFSLGGTITTMLVVLTSLEVLTGVFGWMYYKWMPRRITNLEGDSQVEEAVMAERYAIKRRKKELLEDAPPEVVAVARKVGGKTGMKLSRFFLGYDPAKARAKVLKALERAIDGLDESGQKIVEQLANDGVRLKEIAAMKSLYRIRRGWLALHITITALLVVVIGWHLVAVFYFWS